MVTLRERYLQAAQRADATSAYPLDALPQVLTLACVEVLPVAAAGLSLVADLRLPLGASSPAAAEAERLQTSLGAGPCLTATAESRSLVAHADELDQWPLYASELRRRTPFRSVASLPLRDRVNGAPIGALDLYSTDPTASFGQLAELESGVVEPIAALLLRQLDDLQEPTRLAEELSGTRRRMRVWIAVGMLMGAGATHDDAIALLRGYAFSRDLDLDSAAELLVTRAVSPAEVLTGRTAD